MKITIKTLQQKLFTVDVEPDDTVATIKSKINADHGHPVDSQKLIYSGMSLILLPILPFAAHSDTRPPN
jgi:UV excision repair protein RAD23